MIPEVLPSSSCLFGCTDIQKEACEAWGVELLLDIFPQESEFETPPYSPLWAYATPTEITNKRDRLDEIAWPALVKCVTEPEANFDANWDAMAAALEKEGLEQFNADYTAYLQTKLN